MSDSFESVFPKSAHNDAADQHEQTAKSHRTAAECFAKGEIGTGMQCAEEAQSLSAKAHACSTDAHAKSKV